MTIRKKIKQSMSRMYVCVRGKPGLFYTDDINNATSVDYTVRCIFTSLYSQRREHRSIYANLKDIFLARVYTKYYTEGATIKERHNERITIHGWDDRIHDFSDEDVHYTDIKRIEPSELSLADILKDYFENRNKQEQEQKQKIKENEIELQRTSSTGSREEQSGGSAVCCRRNQVKFAVGTLKYTKGVNAEAKRIGCCGNDSPF